MTATTNLPALYTRDETAWLDAMAALARARDGAGLDWDHLGEYLADMANRDRREVKRRLVILLAHILKWWHQPERRSTSWRLTILEQSRELRALAGSGVLRSHAEAVLAEAYDDAVAEATTETRLPRATFPATCPETVDSLLRYTVPDTAGDD